MMRLLQVTGHEISPAVKGGGYPNTIRKTIHLRCEASKVPTRIEIDISAMSMGSRVMLEDLNLPEGVQVLEKVSHSYALWLSAVFVCCRHPAHDCCSNQKYANSLARGMYSAT